LRLISNGFDIGTGKASTSFLKKRSKKPLPTLSRTSPQRHGQGVKVFWFFFSKKNRFPSPPPGKALQEIGAQEPERGRHQGRLNTLRNAA
jgi:hypothetical protein